MSVKTLQPRCVNRPRASLWGLATIVFITLSLFTLPIIAQEQTITPRDTAPLYSGPGTTYREIDTLRPNDTITLLERNALGNWVNLRVERGDMWYEGWTLTGLLDLDDIHLSEVPVNAALSDAAPYNVADDALARLYSAPVIPTISPAIEQVYRNGLRTGNHSNVITKIGDSLTVSDVYLTPMQRDDHRLGPYDFLSAPIRYYGESLSQRSVASRIGLNTNSVLDPMWADPDRCEAGESPLECEFRRKQPSIAFILFGPNDVVSRMTTEEYDTQMREIVRVTLTHNVIPVLSTFSTNPASNHAAKALDFNLALIDIAADYEVPLMNLWVAARPLPNYGLAGDNIHMQHGTNYFFNFTSGHEATVGISLQNLVALGTLHRLYHALGVSNGPEYGADVIMNESPVLSDR